MKKIYSLILISYFLFACGEPVVEINGDKYIAKIATEAFIYPGEYVKDIRIMRNFPLGQKIDSSKIFITPELNSVVVKINNTPLEFNNSTKTYFSNNLLIEENKLYTIEISAKIDGIQLKTKASTITPKKGFKFINKELGVFKYEVEKPLIEFNTSPTNEFYAFSIMADSANLDNFIYESKFIRTPSREDLKKSFNRFRYQAKYVTNINTNLNSNYKFTVELFDTWFYSPYTVIGYAGDQNFKNFAFTAGRVKEFDGNFHEPILIFDEDGIGVFASAIKDTLRYKIIK